MHNQNKSQSEEFFSIDLLKYVKLCVRNKWIILIITFLFSVFSVFYALSIKNTYVSKTILFPKVQDSIGSRVMSQYGGLAAIAGIELPQGQASNQELAVERLKSIEFFRTYLYEDLVIEIFAAEAWDRENDVLLLNSDLYNIENDTWTREVKWPLEKKPTPEEAHIYFLKQIDFELDSKTGKLEIYAETIRPSTSQKWLQIILDAFNKQNKEGKISDAYEAIEYLEEERNSTDLVDLKSLISELIADQVKTIAFAKIDNNNLFEVIEPPNKPLLKKAQIDQSYA